MDKLLQDGKHEICAPTNRRTLEDTHESSHMEAVEEEQEAILGFAKTRSTRVDGNAVGGIRRPLPSGC